MRRRLTLSAYLLTGLLCVGLSTFAQDIHFINVTRPSEDIGSLITGMAQDAQGFLWLSTSKGLYKYDGNQYTSYHNDPLDSNSLSVDNIYDVFADKSGKVWLATSDAGIDRFDPVTGIFTHFRHHNNDPGSLVNDSALTIKQDHEGTIWIGTIGGLDRFNSKTNTFFHYTNDANDPSSISSNIIIEIFEDKQGTLWVGSGTPYLGYGNGGGLNKLNKNTGKFTRYLHDDNDPQSLIDNRVTSIFEDSRGNFWVGTAGDGLHTMDRTKGTFERHLYDASHPDKLSRPALKKTYSYVDDHITFINEDNNGKIWIGTFEGGINVYDPATQKVTRYGNDKSSKENVGHDDFGGIYKTADNVLWVTTIGQSSNNLYESNLYKIIPYPNNFPYTRLGKVVISLAEGDAHDVWIGTQKGLIHKESNGKEEQFLVDKDTASPANVIFCIEKDNDKFWLTTFRGLYLFDPQTKFFSAYHHQANNSNSLLSDSIPVVKKTTGNQLWIGSANGLDLMNTTSGTFTHFQNNPKDTTSLSSNIVWSVNIDKNQNVWIGTDNGLNRFDKQTNRFRRYLNQLNVTRIFDDSDGTIWCASSAGLFKYDKKKDAFLPFTDETGIISTKALVYSITEDHQKNLWLNGPKGVVRVNKERNISVLYGKTHGVDGLRLSSHMYTLQNGDVVFGDDSGYFDLNPRQLVQNILPPFVAITHFLFNNVVVQPSEKGIITRPLAFTKEIRLNHNQNTFSFEFTNIDFISEPAEQHMLYTLQNYDNTWRKAGDEKTAYYFNLPPGNYIFKVKAINAAGNATEQDIRIIINPPWWSTWWAYTLYAVCFLTLAFFANRFIRNRIVEKERSRAREKELAQAKEIEKAYSELKSTQAQLIQSEKMASLGALTAGIAHEIQNPLNFVNNFSESNKEMLDELNTEIDKGNYSEVKAIARDIIDNEEKIMYHGYRIDAIVKNMLEHSRQGTGQKQATDINALADEYLRLAYHGMRAKDKNFNATLRTELDERIGKINIVSQDIGRVLLNLYNNAFYAVKERLEESRKVQSTNFEPVVTLTTTKEGQYAIITVTDNGSGIPATIRDKIFQPFFTTKPTGQGTGLGLSLSYDIIKAHGGEIKVESKEGEFTNFTLVIPA